MTAVSERGSAVELRARSCPTNPVAEMTGTGTELGKLLTLACLPACPVTLGMLPHLVGASVSLCPSHAGADCWGPPS